MVEHTAVNRGVVGSSPTWGVIKDLFFISFLYIVYTRPVGQAVKTPPFHGGNKGSIPLRVILVAMRPWETPVLIPNTMVKPWTADDTWLETTWESRWLPILV